MRYSVLGGGKRLRPCSGLMAAEACGGDADAAMPAACALEMVHTYSLIHDDLPAMDDDDLRRGRPTCHKAFDEATAILAGDGLLTLAFEVVARDVGPAEAASRCVRVLAEAAGPAGMVGGQMADLQAEKGADERRGRSRPWRRSTAARPGPCSGPRSRWGPPSPGPRRGSRRPWTLRPGGGPGVPDRRRPARRPGRRGEAGQARRQGSGLGKWTYPGLLGIEGSRRGPGSSAEEAVAALAPLGDRGGPAAGPGAGSAGKGPLMIEPDCVAAPDRVAGRPQDALRDGARAARRRDARRADRRRRPAIGPLRQQPRRRRALPGPAPDLRLRPGPPDLGHRPPDLPPQAHHRPGRPSCTRSAPRAA